MGTEMDDTTSCKEPQVTDLGEASDEELPFSAERVMKQHQNEREQMRELGKLIPLSTETSTTDRVTPQTSNAYPIPVRRRAYNPTSMFDGENSPYNESSAIECDLQSFSDSTMGQTPLQSTLKSDCPTKRTSKSVSYGTVEHVIIDDNPPLVVAEVACAETSRVKELENKVDMLMEKMDTILEKLQK